MDQDSDDLLSSASEVANGDVGMRYNVPETAYEQSEHSDDLVHMLNDMHELGMRSDNCRRKPPTMMRRMKSLMRKRMMMMSCHMNNG
jgi:hypothetical protein